MADCAECGNPLDSRVHLEGLGGIHDSPPMTVGVQGGSNVPLAVTSVGEPVSVQEPGSEKTTVEVPVVTVEAAVEAVAGPESVLKRIARERGQ